ncbi:hypothetical protein AMTR_s00091p00055060 [Amborella trichopoda]|uniref:CCHC-type domain-containing protein n=1 Tax=Amborella trichopoda TaxID=13333 RepID=W1NT97_AMBTC|nr:hypothetical protein AMTR_s00091p00055060 [Amborella trichopoda]
MDRKENPERGSSSSSRKAQTVGYAKASTTSIAPTTKTPTVGAGTRQGILGPKPPDNTLKCFKCGEVGHG